MHSKAVDRLLEEYQVQESTEALLDLPLHPMHHLTLKTKARDQIEFLQGFILPLFSSFMIPKIATHLPLIMRQLLSNLSNWKSQAP